MKTILRILGNHFAGVPDAVVNRKWLVLGLFLAGTVLSIVGMGRMKFDMTIEGWFEDDDPTLVALDGYHAEFGSEDHYYIVYKPKDGDIFSYKSLDLLRKIQKDFQTYRAGMPDTAKSPLDHIVKVNTLLNASVLEVRGDALISRRLAGDTVPASAEELAALKQTALAQKSFPLMYFSKDHQYGGILLETDFGAIPLEEGTEGGTSADIAAGSISMEADPGAVQERARFKRTDLADYLSLMNAIKVILDKPEYAGHFEYHPVGNGPTTEYSLAMVEEMGMLNGVTLLIMILLLWLIFRSLSTVVWSVSIVILSVIWTIGFSGLLGLTASPFIMLTVMLILTVGICDTVHLVSGYNFHRRLGMDHMHALRAAYREAALPCLMTACTTIIGLQVGIFTSIVPMKVFAMMSGLGVGMAFLVTVYMLPLMLGAWAPKPILKHAPSKDRLRKFPGRLIPDASAVMDRALGGILPFVDRRKTGIVAASVAIFALCLVGMTRLKVDSDQIKQFPEHTKIRQSYEIVDEKMMGGHFVEILWDLKKENAFQDPAVVKVMDGLQQTLESKYDLVIRTSSVVDVVKDSYMKLNEGKEEMYVIPDSPDALSQTLFLFNNANSEARRSLLSDDYSKAHLSIQMHNTGSYELTRVFVKMRADIDAAMEKIHKDYPEADVSITGLFTLMMEGAQYVTEKGLVSFVAVAGIISLILLFLFSSYRAGLIALAPNLIPFILTFGTMGLLGVSLDFYTLMLASIIVGVSVDDTVHYIAHYRDKYLETGDLRASLKSTINEAGRAVTFTSLVLGLGFGVMAFASNPSTANFGRFGFLAILTGLLNDLFLLPALILMLKPKFKRAAEHVRAQAAASLQPVETAR